MTASHSAEFHVQQLTSEKIIPDLHICRICLYVQSVRFH